MIYKCKFAKRIPCVLLSTILLFNAQAVNMSSYDTQPTEDEMYVYEGNQPTTVTIQDINDLVDESAEALVQGDTNKYEELSQQLDDMGATEISLDEVLRLTGENSVVANENSPVALTAANSVSFRKSNTTFSQYGKSYNIMQITAMPSGQSNGLLYNSNTTTQTYSKSAKAGALAAVSVTATAAAGELSKKVSIATTVYDIVQSVVNALKTTSEVSDVKATYVWNVAETCTFIYVFDNNLGSYRLGARYNKATFAISTAIPSLKIKNLNPVATIYTNKVNDAVSALHYGSIPKAVEYFNKKSTYSGEVGTIKFSGLSNQVVKDVRLVYPMTPAELGYK